jgi:hypothetical protein
MDSSSAVHTYEKVIGGVHHHHHQQQQQQQLGLER